MDERAGPRLERGKSRRVAVLARQEDQLGLRPDLADSRAGIGAGAVGEPEVDQHDVGPELPGARDGFGDRSRLADHGHVLLSR